MDIYAEMIWQRGSARDIVREARRRFLDNLNRDPVAARVAIASAHHSLVKRYVGVWWQKPLAFWHMFHAIRHVYGVLHFERDVKLSADQIDVVTSILVKTPSWLLGDTVCASSLLYSALFLNSQEGNTMKPHSRALMLCTLGEIEYKLGDVDAAWRRFNGARELIPAIQDEDSSDRERQLVRVLANVGFFFWDHGGGLIKIDGRHLIEQSLQLAYRVSMDQWHKTKAECRRRGIKLE